MKKVFQAQVKIIFDFYFNMLIFKLICAIYKMVRANMFFVFEVMCEMV